MNNYILQMEIIIGRDEQTRQLCIKKGGSTKLIGRPGSVPMDVSRRHISLQQVDGGKWQIKNLNEENFTFVNGIAVESKIVSEKDKVELGKSHYLFQWKVLIEPKEETIDIQSLKKIWDDYQLEQIAIMNRQKNNNLIASIPLGFTMLGSIIATVAPETRIVALPFTGIALLLFLYGLYKRSQDNTTIELKRLKEDFDRKWICPKCKLPFSFSSFTILEQYNACPHCKAKFIK